ncbi:MAG: hypothetical protein F4X64_04645 [Chloroflexi bacterium]|nr:hypothetical protein [Chloroflexota bacterium]
MTDEVVIYQTPDVTVTTERVALGDEVIPVASIVSASVGTATAVPPLALGCMVAFFLLIVLVSGIGGCVALTEGSSAGLALIALGVAAAAVMFVGHKFGSRKIYFIIVNTAAGAANSANSRDESSIRAAVEAINNAVISRR